MNKKLKLFVSLLVVSVLAFTSCKKNNEPENPSSSETVYIMGTYNTESFLMTNGQIHYFRRTDNTVFSALDMAVSDNGDVYIVGEVKPDGDSMLPQSILYKNNEECSEYTFNAATFCGIAFKDNGDIALAGLYYGQPAVWDGTTKSDLPLVSRDDIVLWDISSIEYVNGKELIVGTYMVNEAEHYIPVIWLDRQLIEVGQMDNTSTFAFDGAFTSSMDFVLGGINIRHDNAQAFEYSDMQQIFTEIPYQWEGSNASMVYGVVNSSKWNDPSRSIYSLVTEYYEHGHIDPITGRIGSLDSINGGFYLVKNGQVMPETKYKYPKDNTLASVIDMSMNSKGEIVLVGTLYDMEYRNVQPAYWINGECHIINPDRIGDNGVASRVIVKSATDNKRK